MTSILFDSDCGFCRWALGWILRWDRGHRLRPMELQDEHAAQMLEPMPREQQMASWHLVGPDGRVQSAGGAFAPLFRLLPGGGPLAWLADRFPRIVDGIYSRVAGARGSLGPRLSANAIARADRLIASRVAGSGR
jgi:predicted DCC family thiol-disulfide oxidoreductase YuxK